MDLKSLENARQAVYQEQAERESLAQATPELVANVEADLVERWTSCQLGYRLLFDFLGENEADNQAEYVIKVDETTEVGRGLVTTAVKLRRSGGSGVHLMPEVTDEAGFRQQLRGEGFFASFDVGDTGFTIDPDEGITWNIGSGVGSPNRLYALGRAFESVAHAEETIPMLWGALHNTTLNPEAAARLAQTPQSFDELP